MSTSKNCGLFARPVVTTNLVFDWPEGEGREEGKRKIGGGGSGGKGARVNMQERPAVFLSRDPGERRRREEEEEEEGREPNRRERGKEVAGGVPVSICENITGSLRAHSPLPALVSTFHMSPVSPSSPSK